MATGLDILGDKLNKSIEDALEKAEKTSASVEKIGESAERAGKRAKKAKDSVKTDELVNKLGLINSKLLEIQKTTNTLSKSVSSLNKALSGTNSGAGGISKIISELSSAISSYERMGKDINKTGMKSKNFFVDMMIGSYEQRKQLIDAAVRDTEKQVKKAAQNSKNKYGFDSATASAKTIGDFLNQTDQKAYKNWRLIKNELQDVIALMVKMGNVDVTIADKVSKEARALLAEDKVKSAPALLKHSRISNILSSDVAYNDVTSGYYAEYEAARKRRARVSKKQLDEEEADLSKASQAVVKDLKPVVEALQDLTSTLKGLKEGLTNNAYKISLGNAGAASTFKAMGQFFDTIDRSGSKAFDRYSKTNNLHNFYKKFLEQGIFKERGPADLDRIYVESLGATDAELYGGTGNGRKSIQEAKRFSEIISREIANATSKGVQEGIKSGAEEGLKVLNGDEATLGRIRNLSEQLLASSGDEKVSAERRKYAEAGLRIFTGQADPNEALRQEADVQKKRIAEAEKTKRKQIQIQTEFSNMREHSEEAYDKLMGNINRKRQAEADYAEEKYNQILQRRLEKEKKVASTSQRFREKTAEFSGFLQQFEGKDITELDKAMQHLTEETEEFARRRRQASQEGRGNEDEWLRTMRKIQDANRDVLQLMYKQAQGYDEIKKRADKIHKVAVQTQQLFQRASTLTSTVTGILSTIRSQAQNLFGYFRNGIRSLTSQLRSQLSSAISSGTEQFDKLEKARIGFESFFGSQADAVMSNVRSEALKTPIVTSGELADYVSQLAPISGGDSALAINAALGALKSIVYSGNDTSEMEYVVKNIRDVVAKGKATAIDVRQFNRALPAITKALADMGDSEFLKDGELTITPENAKRILTMFANLNTDSSSPVANISERLLETTAGMKQLYTEIKTTAIEQIYRDSGLAQLVKDFYTMLSDKGTWDRGVDVVSGFLKTVVNTIRSVNWKELGSRLSEGGSKIYETLKTIVSQIADVLELDINGKSVTDIVNSFLQNKSLWNQFWDIISTFLQSMGTGLKDFIGTIKNILQNVDANFLKNAAATLGYMLSPMGKLILLAGNLSSKIFAGISRIVGTYDAFTRGISNWQLNRIEGKASTFQKALANSGVKVTDLGWGNNISGNGLAAFGSNKRGYTVINKASSSYIAKDGVGTLVNSAGNATAWGNLTFKEKVSNVGLGSTIRTQLQPVINGLRTAVSKISGVLGVYGLTKTLTSISSMMIKTVAPNLKILGVNVSEAAENFGDILAPTVALGSQFGVAGAAVGALTGSIYKLIKTANDYKKAQEDAADAAREASKSAIQRNFENSILQSLEEQGLYIPYEEKSEDAAKALEDALLGMSDTYLSQHPQEAMQKLLEVYMTRRGVTSNYNVIQDWIDKGVTGTTPLEQKDLQTLKNITETLGKVGIIRLDENDRKTLTDNWESWQGFLKNQGFEFNSSETLNSFSELLDTLQQNYDGWKNKDVDLKLYMDDGNGNFVEMGDASGTKEMWDAWWAAGGFEWNGERYVAKAEIEQERADKQTQEQLEEDLKPIKKFLNGAIWSLLNFSGLFNKGGTVKPIYRATGGGTRGVDSVPAMLQPGEFVVRKSSASKAGLEALTALNRGDLGSAVRSLGSKVNNSWNNSRNWSSVVNNNQRSSRNQINIFNRNSSQRLSQYMSLANRVALA